MESQAKAIFNAVRAGTLEAEAVADPTWIAGCLKEFADLPGDAAFKKLAWSAPLGGPQKTDGLFFAV